MNPVTKLMSDKTTGRLRDDIRKEQILSCVLELYFLVRKSELFQEWQSF